MSEFLKCGWIESFDDSFSKELNQAKRHPGQRKVASIMRDLLTDGKLLKNRMSHLFDGEQIKVKEYFSEKVQEYYSLRCVPQILGPVLDTLNHTEKILIEEFMHSKDVMKEKNV